MRRGALAAALACALLAGAAVVAHARLTERSRLSTAGVDSIRIGMTEREAERAGGGELIPSAPATGRCRYLRPVNRSIPLAFMVIRERIARVDAHKRGIATTRGIKVQDSERAVRRAYGSTLRRTPNAYDPKGSYLEYVPRERAQRHRRIVFETDGRRVTFIRAGRLPEVRYIEGCS